jgi:heptaprenyl diphosphate synthase
VKTAERWADHLHDQELAADISAGLSAVEELLWESIKDEQPFITETSGHLIRAGGKRLRPLLSLLCAQLGDDPLGPQVVSGATSCEIVHIATLYHDDVMDEAKLRRGATSANVRWGNTVAILTGDFLFAVAAKMGSKLGPYVVDVQTTTSRRLVTGQLRETVGWSPNLSQEEHYMKVVSDKTASLMAASCNLGARLSGAPDELVELVSEYAEALGIAFQLSDDIIDITGDETTGKDVGADLREGVPTLPVIYVRQAGDPADARLLELIEGGVAEEDLPEALALLRAHQAIDRVRSELKAYVDQSFAVLDKLPDIPATRALRSLAEYLITRQA